jgi:ribosomal protein L12E/L44/L45/RPP1/RPP2
MVFISFPTSFTSEEDFLMKKYEKLDKKRKAKLVTKVEPEVVTDNVKPLEVQNAKDVIAKLKKTGQLPVIQSNKKSEFKRKQPATAPVKTNAVDEEEAREVVSYDDLFS